MNTTAITKTLLTILAFAMLPSCGDAEDEQAVTLRFNAVVGGQQALCN
ncbi:MAG: hypothetical protein AAFY60_09570 [Myxococcota bacterium]